MHIIKKQSLKEFWEKHQDSEQQLKAWHSDVEKAKWQNFNDLKEDYSTAKVIVNNRAIFKIKGNAYRLIVKISFLYQKCYIKFVGTHTEYDKVDAETIDKVYLSLSKFNSHFGFRFVPLFIILFSFLDNECIMFLILFDFWSSSNISGSLS